MSKKVGKGRKKNMYLVTPMFLSMQAFGVL